MTKETNSRILALDVLRGITIAGMILVNNPGSGQYIFAPLEHAEWIGVTPTDMVFPFFMFIMGFSMFLSLRKFDFRLTPSSAWKVVRRTILIFLIGLLLTWMWIFVDGWVGSADSGLGFFQRLFQSAFDFSHLRIMGVLQRLALAYGLSAFIILTMRSRRLLWIAAALFAVYFCILLVGNGFVNSQESVLYRFDVAVMGANHLWDGDIIDPEGLLGTIPSVAHVLLGFCAARLAMTKASLAERIEVLFVYGTVLLLAGMLLSYGCPISKKIWTPTFSLFTCGLASSLLALLAWVIDGRGWHRWSFPFQVFGVNPLFLYALSGVMAVLFTFVYVPVAGSPSIHDWLYQSLMAPVFGNYGGSVGYALLFVLLNGMVGYILYKKKIYIKV
ncbi:acyltransferase family protein [Prevotella sp. KH2C16]|uniref:acyltransferase family protein n=1 Tax=Prevotella sp. KH2C16 TaxID=1855325 RepID=UPI0008E0FB8E|nr:DUF5009 domain-containing protein [Prevotella sp. KH2C16]SFG46153.1 Predicted acyltransferase [Prevotella sp. KH2C16]